MSLRGSSTNVIALLLAWCCALGALTTSADAQSPNAQSTSARSPNARSAAPPTLRRLAPPTQSDRAESGPSSTSSSRKVQNTGKLGYTPPARSAGGRPKAVSPQEKHPVRKASAQEPATEEMKPSPKQREPRSEEPEEPSEGPHLLPSPNHRDQERLLQFDPPRRPAELSVNMDGELITLNARGAPLADVVEAIAEQHGLNLVAGDEVAGVITVSLRKVTLQEALRAVLLVNGFTWHQDGNILVVSDLSAESRTPKAQRGALVRVFELNFIAADDVDKVVQGLLSPIGTSFITASQNTDKRKTREELVVQDLPEYVDRIEQYVAQVDRPPRQVLVEAHILQVDLRDELRHGVNLTAIARVAGAELSLRNAGLANPTASPALFFGINGTDLDALLEAMRTLTDAKTLASPKVLVVNGQEAKLQVGGQLGYFMTTTTQTSSMQSVQFLDVGVVMTVTPVIADDGNVLMTVKPEVSQGRINAQTNLPEKETTQTQTTLMLQSGQGMVIGGLIQEKDQETVSKVPLLGDAWLVGSLFRRKVTEQRRQELIIAIVPRIVPLTDCAAEREKIELDRAFTPLLHGPICSTDRSRWEPVIPGTREGRPLKQRECEEAACNPLVEPQYCDRDRVQDETYIPEPVLEEVRRPAAPTSGKSTVRMASKPPVVSGAPKKNQLNPPAKKAALRGP